MGVMFTTIQTRCLAVEKRRLIGDYSAVDYIHVYIYVYKPTN